MTFVRYSLPGRHHHSFVCHEPERTRVLIKSVLTAAAPMSQRIAFSLQDAGPLPLAIISDSIIFVEFLYQPVPDMIRANPIN
jgi:hypothetical protein